MSKHCYVCDYNFSSANEFHECIGCGHTIKVDECSDWSRCGQTVYKIQDADGVYLKGYNRDYWTQPRHAKSVIRALRKQGITRELKIVEFELVEKGELIV